jgi:hypothetical protein
MPSIQSYPRGAREAPPVTRVPESEPAGDSGGPDALKSPGRTLARRECRLPRSPGDDNVSWMAGRS